jgi:hypothetical protein
MEYFDGLLEWEYHALRKISKLGRHRDLSYYPTLDAWDAVTPISEISTEPPTVRLASESDYRDDDGRHRHWGAGPLLR